MGYYGFTDPFHEVKRKHDRKKEVRLLDEFAMKLQGVQFILMNSSKTFPSVCTYNLQIEK